MQRRTGIGDLLRAPVALHLLCEDGLGVRVRDGERAVGRDGVVRQMLRVLLGDGVVGVRDRLPASDLVNLRGDRLQGERAVDDVRGPEGLEVVGVLQRRCRDDRRETLQLGELDGWMMLVGVSSYILQRSGEVISPYCPTEDEPPRMSAGWPLNFVRPPSSHGAGKLTECDSGS